MDANGSTPLTRQDLTEVLETFAGRLDRLERAVTTLPTRLYTQARLASVRDTALETRVAQIEDRLLDIEQQIAKPPAA